MDKNRQQGLAGLWERMQPWLILLAGVCYWGAYLRYWFNPHDEGGTAALTAQRLAAGELPIRDVALGYNVLWFYPVVWLFKVTGVHYIKMRAYFLGLSACTALAGWAVVRRLTGRSWLAFATGLLLVVFPGSQFKNYIPLLGMLNLLCLVRAFSRLDVYAGVFGTGWRGSQFYGDCVLGGLVLGLSFLVRIDLGFLFSAVWAGMLVVQLTDLRLGVVQRVVRLFAGIALLGVTVWGVHLPVLADARARGYLAEFTGQYVKWADYLLKSASELRARTAGVSEGGKPAAAAAGQGDAKAAGSSGAGSLRARLVAADFLRKPNWDTGLFLALTYLPALGFAGWLGLAVWGGGCAWRRREWSTAHPCGQLVLVVVASLATFPQFFFFRPDRPHLSEFMVGYLVVMACGVAMVFRPREGGRRPGWMAWGVAGVCLLHLGIYAWVALDHPSAGTIAARVGRRHWFQGENGVGVWASRKEFEHLTAVRNAIQSCSREGEPVVCYPYQPGYNLMTNRLTYERDLYVDNVTHGPGWSAELIRTLEKRRPAAVVVDNRAINGDDASRFSFWAAPVYEYLRSHYRLVGSSRETEVYGRTVAPGETGGN